MHFQGSFNHYYFNCNEEKDCKKDKNCKKSTHLWCDAAWKMSKILVKYKKSMFNMMFLVKHLKLKKNTQLGWFQMRFYDDI